MGTYLSLFNTPLILFSAGFSLSLAVIGSSSCTAISFPLFLPSGITLIYLYMIQCIRNKRNRQNKRNIQPHLKYPISTSHFKRHDAPPHRGTWKRCILCISIFFRRFYAGNSSSVLLEGYLFSLHPFK